MRTFVQRTFSVTTASMGSGAETAVTHAHGLGKRPSILGAWISDAGGGVSHYCSFALRTADAFVTTWAARNNGPSAAAVTITYVVAA